MCEPLAAILSKSITLPTVMSDVVLWSLEERQQKGKCGTILSQDVAEVQALCGSNLPRRLNEYNYLEAWCSSLMMQGTQRWD